MGRQQRQRPISCHFCRVRKLRCSRQFPCSNCTSRGVPCQQGPDAGTAAPSGASAVQRNSLTNKDAAVPEMLSRLEKLEALVASQGKELELSRRSAYPRPRPSLTPSAPSPVPSNLERLAAEGLWLEDMCTGQKSITSSLSHQAVFRTCPLRFVTKQPPFVFHNPKPLSSTGPSETTRCIWLPPREESRALVHKYINEISHLHHVVHIPSLWSTIDKLYDSFSGNGHIELGTVLLVLSICASVTYSWAPEDLTQSLFASHVEANGQSNYWLKASLDVVDHAERSMDNSLEGIQGGIILFFVTCNVEGISSRTRSLILRCINMARELSLHRIDSQPYPCSSSLSSVDSVRAEIGRRVWWYLVGTDWMMSHYCRHQEDTYNIHPNHMTVQKPRNITDEDLVDGTEPKVRGHDEPTDASYLIQRIRMAETCRELLDQSSPLGNMDYDLVAEMDDKWDKFAEGIPSILRMDHSDFGQLLSVDNRLQGALTAQRYTMNLIMHRQRCKLHLPYLARSGTEPEFERSRKVCVDSARSIIRIERLLKSETFPSLSYRLKAIMLLRSVFVATVALVLDACLASDLDESWDAEDCVADAWRMLGEAQPQSPMAGRLLELSMQVLRAHNIAHPALEAIKRQTSSAETLLQQPGPMPMTPESAYRNDQGMAPVPQQAGHEQDQVFLEQQWQALEGGMGLDFIDWEKLFWGLDAPFM